MNKQEGENLKSELCEKIKLIKEIPLENANKYKDGNCIDDVLFPFKVEVSVDIENESNDNGNDKDNKDNKDNKYCLTIKISETCSISPIAKVMNNLECKDDKYFGEFYDLTHYTYSFFIILLSRYMDYMNKSPNYDINFKCQYTLPTELRSQKEKIHEILERCFLMNKIKYKQLLNDDKNENNERKEKLNSKDDNDRNDVRNDVCNNIDPKNTQYTNLFVYGKNLFPPDFIPYILCNYPNVINNISEEVKVEPTMQNENEDEMIKELEKRYCQNRLSLLHWFELTRNKFTEKGEIDEKNCEYHKNYIKHCIKILYYMILKTAIFNYRSIFEE